MKKIVECVPNFSEGHDEHIINAIAESIKRIGGVKLLSVEPDKDYNRTVVTFVGEPEAVRDAAFASTKTAAELIDMTTHKGEHPRIGATDVVPFIPVSGVTMQECVTLAEQYGEKVAAELGIPIYLYEDAARKPERKNLAVVRKGEYEGLAEKLQLPEWQPDFGSTTFNPKSGATVTGARFFLVAYNVNLASNNKDAAHEIALRIRESGRTTKNPDGTKTTIPGSLKFVKAMGVLLERFNIAQVSINLTNYTVTPPHIAFEEVKNVARTLGEEITGSEIVGLLPKSALLMAGKFYTQGGELSEQQLIETAVNSLGLNNLETFNPQNKIIEYMI